MVSAAQTFNGDQGFIDHGARGSDGIPASWHGFRLAALDGVILAPGTPPSSNASAIDRPLGASAAAAKHPLLHLAATAMEAITPAAPEPWGGAVLTLDERGSLLWVGMIACWLSALFTLTLIVSMLV